ncbi:hypothetical protein [Bordetella tumulicola]|uniref:hypothetical protein n=1 Tax=Bordetella tumulicola TaxID=1649133 RepID=UPI0039EFDB3E
MSGRYISIGRLARRFSNGETEALKFEPGVNLLIGPPNTGKTKWLQMLDHLLGDPSSFESTFDEQLFAKYDSISAELVVGEETLLVERRWKEPGSKTKVFVDGEGLPARDFQHLLLQKLDIPLMHFPRGNPFSGQTWPELSFRMLLRHIYRQQRFWSGIADQQIEAEQHACLLQFLGLAEHIYTEKYGQLVGMKLAVERLKARREQYGSTLNELARDLLNVEGLEQSVNAEVVRQAEERIDMKLNELRDHRIATLVDGRNNAVANQSRGRIEALSEKRAALIVTREEQFRQTKATTERLEEMQRYRDDLTNELARLHRAEDAGALFADLKITHCPACDQTVAQQAVDVTDCHLCHQHLPVEPMVEGLGAARLQFENNRLTGELQEAETLLVVLGREVERLAHAQLALDEQLRMAENELAPAREAVSALVSEELTAIDMAMGELNERQRQVKRLTGAVELGEQLTGQIEAMETEIAPLQVQVDDITRATDFGHGEELLSSGMTFYLNALNRIKPNVWRHSAVDVNLSRSAFSIKVGSRRWSSALGGTDTLYFLMSYHFGLLSLSSLPHCHYPGLSIIDLPGDFLGESIEDKENFIVQPFIDLLAQDSFMGAQVIMTGASFKGLTGVHRTNLHKVYVG